MSDSDPTSLSSSTDFDSDNPVRFEWKGQKIEVHRLAAQSGFGAISPTPPRIIMTVSGSTFPLRAARNDDTRETIRADAEAYLMQRDLSKLTDDELRRLQAELPPIINDASNPVNDERNAIIAEGKRRGMW